MDIHSILITVTEVVGQTAEVVTQTTEHAAKADPGILGTLGINWKIFLGQLLNFSIVLFIFWKWIVNPLGATLAARQEKIEAGLKNAQAMEIARKELEITKENEIRNARIEAERIIKGASDTATRLKQEIMAEAQAQSAKILDQTKIQVQSEKDQMLKEVKQEVATLVVAASEKILHAKLDSKKDHELIEVSLKSLNK